MANNDDMIPGKPYVADLPGYHTRTRSMPGADSDVDGARAEEARVSSKRVGFHIRIDEVTEDGQTIYRATYTDPAKASIGSFTGTTRDEAVQALDAAWEERTGVRPRQVGPRVLIQNNVAEQVELRSAVAVMDFGGDATETPGTFTMNPTVEDAIAVENASDRRKSLTVAELIEALSAVKNKSLRVSMEGCDCYGDAGSVDEEPGCVYIYRSQDDDE